MSTVVGDGFEGALLISQGYASGSSMPCFGSSVATACIPLGAEAVGSLVNFSAVPSGSIINFSTVAAGAVVNFGTATPPTFPSFS